MLTYSFWKSHHSYAPTVIIHFICSAVLLSPFFCFVLWKLIFHPLFVFFIFPKVPTSLFLFVQLQFIKHSWRCRNVLFHYCAINHFSCSFSPAVCGHPRPSTPNSISLVWQLLSWKMAVTASATHTEKYMKGRGKLNDYHLNAHAKLQLPMTHHRMGLSQWKLRALVKTGQSGWGSSSAVGHILQAAGFTAVVDTKNRWNACESSWPLNS